MNQVVYIKSPWSTSSFADAPDTSPMELSALGEHLGTCKRSHGRLFALQCHAERFNRFVAARFVTTVSVAGLLIAFVAVWF